MLELQGKVAFVFGVASEDSIAWAICEKLSEAGVTLYLGYQKRFMSRVFQLKEKLPGIAGMYPLDVASDELTAEFFTAFSAENPGLKADILIHAIGFAPKECFDRPIIFVEDDKINTAMTISANSLQLIIVVLGLGLIIKNNILILLILKWVGVFYLIYIAIDLYKSKAKIINSENINKKNILSFYKDGFLVAALSPKAWIFFSVIFIQFLNYNLNFLNFITQLIILWISYIFLDFITLILYGVTAKKISMWLKSNPKTINVISALALFIIAIYIAFN